MCRLLAAVFAGATAVLVGISLGFPSTGHYAVSFTYEGAQYGVAHGLLQTCTSSPQWTTCDWLNTNEVRLPSCTRAGVTYAARFITAAALIGLGGLLSLVTVFTPICCVPRSSAIAMTTLLTFAFACIATAGGLFYFSVFWLYCDVPDVCDHYTALGATACSEHITLYAWLGIAAAGTALLGLCFGIAGIAMTPPRPADETEQDVIADDNEEGDAEACAACAAFRIEIADVKQRLAHLERFVASPCHHPNAVVVGTAAGNSPSSSDCTHVVSGTWQRRHNPIEQAASDWAAADEAEALTDERPAREVIRVAVPH